VLRVLVSLALVAAAYAGGAKYADTDPVVVVANKIGPYYNPTETYEYFSLPFCRPGKLQKQRHNLGEILAGDRKVGLDVGS